MTIRSWREDYDMETIPIQVVIMTKQGMDSQWFSNLAEARRLYPTLDPFHSTGDFTWAMRGETPDGEVCARYEDSATYRTLST
jgi:hypothetical protein